MGDKILVLGAGKKHSFSIAYAKRHPNDSVYETQYEVTKVKKQTPVANLKFHAKSFDVTKKNCWMDLQNKKFNIIFFNNPHVGFNVKKKEAIQTNKLILDNCIKYSENYLEIGGCLIVNLPRGCKREEYLKSKRTFACYFFDTDAYCDYTTELTNEKVHESWGDGFEAQSACVEGLVSSVFVKKSDGFATSKKQKEVSKKWDKTVRTTKPRDILEIIYEYKYSKEPPTSRHSTIVKTDKILEVKLKDSNKWIPYKEYIDAVQKHRDAQKALIKGKKRHEILVRIDNKTYKGLINFDNIDMLIDDGYL